MTYPAAQLETIQSTLAQFSGTENYYRSSAFTKDFVHTDGVHYLATTFGAFWLIDAIVSHQGKASLKREGFQAWTLRTRTEPEGQAAILICDDGNGNELARQNIPYTDFPLPEITLYLVDGSLDGEHLCKVLELPSEY
jgi:hypothetical protein